MKQLILVIETNDGANTDKVYIDKTIHCFFNVASVKLQYVNMDGKYNYQNPKVLNSIDSFTKMNGKDKTYIIYFFDKDSTNNKNKKFLKSAKQFCQNNKFEMVLFNRTVEEVFCGIKVKAHDKLTEAKRFAKNGNPINFKNQLSHKDPSLKESDMLVILKKYLAK